MHVPKNRRKIVIFNNMGDPIKTINESVKKHISTNDKN